MLVVTFSFCVNVIANTVDNKHKLWNVEISLLLSVVLVLLAGTCCCCCCVGGKRWYQYPSGKREKDITTRSMRSSTSLRILYSLIMLSVWTQRRRWRRRIPCLVVGEQPSRTGHADAGVSQACRWPSLFSFVRPSVRLPPPHLVYT